MFVLSLIHCKVFCTVFIFFSFSSKFSVLLIDKPLTLGGLISVCLFVKYYVCIQHFYSAVPFSDERIRKPEIINVHFSV